MEISTTKGPLRLRDDIVLFLQHFWAQSSSSKQAGNIGVDLTYLKWHKLPSQLVTLTKTIVAYSKELRIVESLRYAEITEREERIVCAHPRTFDWLFTEYPSKSGGQPPVPLLQWLRALSGTYWISGRAGSGKSTLMKYLYQHEETLAALKTWAGEKQLVTASFFFWHAGTEMQKSQQGLLQTLLFHILKECPQMVQSVCRLRWEAEMQLNASWTAEQLHKAFDLLKKNDLGMTRFCFFIDGLDEYKGEHTDIIDTVNNLVFGSNIKVVFSSRPWVIFEQAYGENHFNKLQLHEYTEDDIHRFVTDKFMEDVRFQELQGSDRRYEALIEQIVKRAHGVFLWVYLVVRSLRRGLVNCDTLDELHARLHTIPTDLEEYFRKMLDSKEKMYHKQAARIYQMCISASGDVVPLTILSFFDRSDSNFCLAEEMNVWSPEEIRQIRMRTRTRVMARCTDLLEVSTDRNCIMFLHRTVYDFLTTREVRELLEDRAGLDFDADLHLGNATVCELKHLASIFLRPPFDLDEHSESLIRHFVYSIHKLELRGHQGYLPLVDELEKVIDTFRGDTVPTYSSIQVPTNLAAQCPDGWVKVMAIKRRLLLYLSRERQLGLLDRETRFAGRPPLDIVLRPHLDTLRYLPLPVLSVQLVTLFLEVGMDPNQNHEDSTVWGLFLHDLGTEHPLGSGVSSHELAEIFESLLTAGADPDFGPGGTFIWEVVSCQCTLEDAKHVEGVRLRMRAQKLRENCTIIASSDPATSQTSAQPSRNRGFRRVKKRLAIRN